MVDKNVPPPPPCISLQDATLQTMQEAVPVNDPNDNRDNNNDNNNNQRRRDVSRQRLIEIIEAALRIIEDEIPWPSPQDDHETPDSSESSNNETTS